MKKRHQKEPEILTRNMKFQRPGYTSYHRLTNVNRQMRVVDNYFQWLGFATLVGLNSIHAEKHTRDGKRYKATFAYAETETTIHKSLSVIVDGKTSNITTLRKLYPK